MNLQQLLTFRIPLNLRKTPDRGEITFYAISWLLVKQYTQFLCLIIGFQACHIRLNNFQDHLFSSWHHNGPFLLITALMYACYWPSLVIPTPCSNWMEVVFHWNTSWQPCTYPEIFAFGLSYLWTKIRGWWCPVSTIEFLLCFLSNFR